MFMLQRVSKYIFGNESKESIAEIPQGELYLVRPNSQRGLSELIFKDAAASIRKTSQEFHSQLVVQRAFEEGEEELLAEEEEEGNAEAGPLSDPDEKTFLLDQELQFRFAVRPSGETVFSWSDLNGAAGDRYEFVCNLQIDDGLLDQFYRTALGCQFERKFKQLRSVATDEDLNALVPEPLESAIASENPFINDTENTVASNPPSPSISIMSRHSEEKEFDEMEALEREVEEMNAQEASPMKPPTEKIEFFEGTSLIEETGELNFFDFGTGAFVLQDSVVSAKVVDLGGWDYQLQITSDETDWMAQIINADTNPVFNFEFRSFIFNHYTKDGSAYSWLLRFPSEENLENFQRGFMQAMWENANEVKWGKNKDKDNDYILEAFQDMTMDDIPEEDEDEDEEERERERSRESDDESETDGEGELEEEDSEEDDDDDNNVAGQHKKKGAANSQLAVGYKHDRSFVVRGSSIGVFKHTEDNRLKLTAHISEIKAPDGKTFDPTKIMLHESDTNLIIQDSSKKNSLYQMDLETGKVVEEWKVHDDIPITNFAPNSKFAQMSGEKTFIGMSNKALYQVDPRLSGNKMVTSQLKHYATKTDFSAIATTEDGYIAVASNKGDIRLFDRLGINAKTALPALGDPILGLDVSADGRWVLATTRTYVLLVDAMQHSGKNEGKLGFQKGFAADQKPQPRRLALTPSHVAQFTYETSMPISFTPAKFNTGVDSTETTIIAATGPFVISWSLKKVLANRKDPYVIKRYSEEVKADNFKFGSDKDMIVALPNEVNMVNKTTLRKATRESIAALPSMSRKSLRRTNLWKTDIVDSPY